MRCLQNVSSDNKMKILQIIIYLVLTYKMFVYFEAEPAKSIYFLVAMFFIHSGEKLLEIRDLLKNK